MSRFETIGADLDLAELNKHNRNLDRADEDLTSHQQQINTEKSERIKADSAEQQARIAADSAHANSTSAHPAQNITYSGSVIGASNVKQAIDTQHARINTIIGGAGSSNTEIMDARLGLDGVVHPVLKGRLDRMEQRQLAAQDQTAQLIRGVNVIQSDQASGATFNVLGCTLCNILGPDGGFAVESSVAGVAKGWIKAGATASYSLINEGGRNAQRIASLSRDTDRWGRRVDRHGVRVESGKHYVFIVQVTTNGSSPLINADHSGGARAESGAVLDSVMHVKFSPTTADSVILRLYNTSSIGIEGYVQFYGARLYEVSAADYAAIGTTITGEAIDRRWPYVDSVQHTRGLSVMMPGKNLLPPFTQWTLHSTATSTVIEPYKLQFQPTASSQRSYTNPIAVVPGQQYTLSQKGSSSQFYFIIFDSVLGGTIVNTTNGVTSRTFTAPASGRIVIATTNAATTGTWIFEEPQLELGATSSAFEAYNPSYANADTILASNVDRSIADSYDSATGEVFRRIASGIKIDSSLTWLQASSHAGYRRLSAPLPFPVLSASSKNQFLVRYDGMIFQFYAAVPTADNQFLAYHTDQRLYFSLSHTETGWSGPAPNDSALRALANGWRANGNNGTVYNSWVSVLDGSPPPTNTEAYVAANKVTPGFAYATLDYVRATPITEQLTGDLGGLAMVKGGNTVELLEGVVVRERAYPKLDGSGWYIISADSSEFWGTSRVKYATRKFLAVYKGADIDNNWTAISGPPTYISTRATTYTAAEIAANEWYVDYIVMDKHTYTANAVDATLNYQSSQGSVIGQNVQDIAAIKTHDGVQDWILAQHTARLLALEEA